ncbi:MAG TPA: alpha/beta hydrolase [Candidatus Saccharimonadia bacterium]|nr:alpha/beta hydrolase [Candidatus Saccharimonadia bacterium]
MSRINVPTAQLATVTASDGLMLPALWYEPAVASKRLMAWLHGMGSSGIFYSVEHTNALAEAFVSSGTAFLGLQNRGGGMLQGLKYYDQNGVSQRRLQGTSHELIAECVHDIEGAVTFAREQGYSELYLGGHSTGANKVALFNYLCPQNPFSGYVLYGGGDDTGLFYEQLGAERYQKALTLSKRMVKSGHGADLAPFDLLDDYFSFQSTCDILDPDGAYNTFPFYESQSGSRLGTKPLFQEYKSIDKPTLVIYGADDEYCKPNAAAAVEMLKRESSNPSKFSFQLIPNADHGGHPSEGVVAEAIAKWLNSTSQDKHK